MVFLAFKVRRSFYPSPKAHRSLQTTTQNNLQIINLYQRINEKYRSK